MPANKQHVKLLIDIANYNCGEFMFLKCIAINKCGDFSVLIQQILTKFWRVVPWLLCKTFLQSWKSVTLLELHSVDVMKEQKAIENDPVWLFCQGHNLVSFGFFVVFLF